MHLRVRSRLTRRAITLALGVALVATTACGREKTTTALRMPDGAADQATPATEADPVTSTSATPGAPASSIVASTAAPAAGRTRSAATVARTAPRNPLMPLTDTGLTRVRVSFDNNASWVSAELAGTDIKAIRVVSTSGAARISGMGPVLAVNNPGTAVFELVLGIAPDAAPGLTVCKASQGDATVTVTRITDAAADVAKVTDTGTDQNAPQAGCANRVHADVTRSALMGAVRWPARVDGRPLVLAHYYPWYDADALKQNFGDQPTGPADTNDPAAVRDAIALAKSSGIDGFAVEFEGAPENADRLESILSAADAQPGFTTALTLDLEILRARNHNVLSNSVLDDALRTVAAKTAHSSQLRVNGQPVLFLYAGYRTNPSQWSGALQRLYDATQVRPFVVSDDATLGAPGAFQYSTKVEPDLAHLLQWAGDELNRVHIQPAIQEQPSPLWVAPVSPGYDDTRLHRSHPIYVDRANGQRYQDEWSAALTSLPDWVVITSWNEYYEQTHVAPGSTSGTRALTQTADYAARFHATG